MYGSLDGRHDGESPPKQHDVLLCFSSRVLEWAANECEFRASIPSVCGSRTASGWETLSILFSQDRWKINGAPTTQSDLRNSHLLVFFGLFFQLASRHYRIFGLLLACLHSFRRDTRQIALDNLSWKSARMKDLPRQPRQDKLLESSRFSSIETSWRDASKLIANSLDRSSISLSRKTKNSTIFDRIYITLEIYSRQNLYRLTSF